MCLYRIVTDGDIIPSLSTGPWSLYEHVGTEVLVDGLGDSGSIIINPSYIEQALLQKTIKSVSAHSLDAYMNGLTNIKKATAILNDQLIHNNNIRNTTIHDTIRDIDMINLEENKSNDNDIMNYTTNIDELSESKTDTASQGRPIAGEVGLATAAAEAQTEGSSISNQHTLNHSSRSSRGKLSVSKTFLGSEVARTSFNMYHKKDSARFSLYRSVSASFHSAFGGSDRHMEGAD